MKNMLLPPPQGHETGHATGAKHRLDRDLTGRFGSAKYAMDEGVTQMSVRKRTWKTAAGDERQAWLCDYHVKTFARKKDADAFNATGQSRSPRRRSHGGWR